MPISQIVTNSIADDVTIKFADGSASTPSITNNGDTNTGIFFPAADTIAFTEGGVESMRIDSSGNVLIGTTSANGSTSNNQPVVAGIFRSLSGSGTVPDGTTLNLFTIPTASTWIVSLQTGNASGLSATAIASLASGGNPVVVTVLKADNAAFTITFSGTSIQASNTLGGVVGASWNAIRLF
jgi:hypothetical protein